MRNYIDMIVGTQVTKKKLLYVLRHEICPKKKQQHTNKMHNDFCQAICRLADARFIFVNHFKCFATYHYTYI